MLEIRKASTADRDGVWEIIKAVIKSGDTYVFSPDSPREKILGYWFGAEIHTYVAELDQQIVGTFVISDNQPDLGSHIANGSYMTAPEFSGQGVGTKMGLFSIKEAKRLGYRAMQFNLVVKSNSVAVHLWQKLGFEIIGEIPEAFDHASDGLTNAYVMYRRL